MPVHNVHPLLPNASAADLLERQGLLLKVEIHVATALAANLTQGGAKLPAPIIGNALVDTGATCCCAEESCLAKLGLQPTGQIHMAGATGPRLQNVYLARFSFPGTPIPALELTVAGVQMHAAQTHGNSTVVLIGRDVLRHCVLVYNGPLGCYTLAF